MLFRLFSGGLDFTSALVEILAILVIIFLVLPFHEWAHAFTASKLGDTSIKYRGRLTLNPLSHIDPFGALALLLFGFGWAKPVPVDPRNFKKPKLGMGIVALMGPVANIVAALAGGLIFTVVSLIAPDFFPVIDGVRVVGNSQVGYYVSLFISYYISVNITLAVFNLLPIPPLDGSKILFVFLPDRLVVKFYQYQMFISIALLALLWMGVLNVPINYLSKFVLEFIKLIMPPCKNLLLA